MSTARLTIDDVRLRQEALARLERDPDFDASAVGVSAREGVVTLTGYIETCAAKLAAERTVKLARGVRAVANDLQVRTRIERTDTEIALDAARALEVRITIPDTVQATVHHGHITLTGAVPWQFQRQSAEETMRHVHGARRVHNLIRLVPEPPSREDAHRIVVIRNPNERFVVPVR